MILDTSNSELNSDKKTVKLASQKIDFIRSVSRVAPSGGIRMLLESREHTSEGLPVIISIRLSALGWDLFTHNHTIS